MERLNPKQLSRPEVLIALQTYVSAYEACQEARRLYEEYTFDTKSPDVQHHMNEINRLRLVYLNAHRLQTVLYRVCLDCADVFSTKLNPSFYE